MQRCLKSKGNGIVEKRIKIFRLLMKSILRICPLYFGMTIIVGSIHSLLTVGNVIVLQIFLDSILSKNDMKSNILLAIIVGIAMILTTIFNGMHNYMFEVLSKKVSGKLRYDFQKKVSKIEPIHFESSKFLDQLKMAGEGIDAAANLIIMVTFFLTFYLLYFIVLACYFYNLYPGLLWGFVFILVPVFLSQFIKSKFYEKYLDKTMNLNRRYKYYFNCIADKKYFKETRVLNAAEFFFPKFIKDINKATGEMWESQKKMALAEMILKGIAICGYGIVFLLLIFSLSEEHITVGVCSTIFIAIRQIYELLNELFGRQIGMIIQNFANIKFYLEIMNIEESVQENLKVGDDTIIRLEDINFSYPNMSELVIKNLSVSIGVGKVLAIVGYNGSGKSTLAKILCGMYKPQTGKIYGGKAEKHLISAVFQNFAQYKLSVKENVLISDFHNEENVKKELDEVAFDYLILENGIESLVGREFGGTELSGGQWQRLAIARGIHKEYDFIILDEPNSAIDPFEEEKLYERFAEIVKGKSAVLITHRLNSVKIADEIIVMEKGKIVEKGTHEELMNNNGKYRKMYEAQKKWYIQEVEN